MIRRCCPRLAIIAGTGAGAPSESEVTPSMNSFLVDPKRLNEVFHEKMQGKNHIYLKGAVHECKSSWARSYAEQNPQNACYIACNMGVKNEDAMGDTIVEQYNFHVTNHCNGSPPLAFSGQPLPSFPHLVHFRALPSTFTLLFDECHALFAFLNSAVGALFVKRSGLACKVAYLSTTQYGVSHMGLSTPPHITNKWILPWRFTHGEVAELIPCMLEGKATPTAPCPDETADLVHGLFCGHRGMTVMALEYVARQVKNDMSFAAMHSALCKMLQGNQGALQSRAAKINGMSARKFPHDYGRNMTTLVQSALASGRVSAADASKAPSDVQFGVTIGVFTPLSIAWNVQPAAVEVTDNDNYSFPNPLLARRLAQDIGSRPWKFCSVPPTQLAVDAVVTGLANLSYSSFFSVSGAHTSRDKQVWFEDPINNALLEGMNSSYGGYHKPFAMGAPTSKPSVGKPDIVGFNGQLIIENMVYKKKEAVKEHYERFRIMEEYQHATQDNRSGPLVVCCGTKQSQDVEQSVETDCFSNSNQAIREKIPVLIVSIDWASLWEFKVTYMQFAAGKVKRTTETIRADLQAWKFDVASQTFQPASDQWVRETVVVIAGKVKKTKKRSALICKRGNST